MEEEEEQQQTPWRSALAEGAAAAASRDIGGVQARNEVLRETLIYQQQEVARRLQELQQKPLPHQGVVERDPVQQRVCAPQQWPSTAERPWHQAPPSLQHQQPLWQHQQHGGERLWQLQEQGQQERLWQQQQQGQQERLWQQQQQETQQWGRKQQQEVEGRQRRVELRLFVPRGRRQLQQEREEEQRRRQQDQGMSEADDDYAGGEGGVVHVEEPLQLQLQEEQQRRWSKSRREQNRGGGMAAVTGMRADRLEADAQQERVAFEQMVAQQLQGRPNVVPTQQQQHIRLEQAQRLYSLFSSQQPHLRPTPDDCDPPLRRAEADSTAAARAEDEADEKQEEQHHRRATRVCGAQRRGSEQAAQGDSEDAAAALHMAAEVDFEAAAANVAAKAGSLRARLLLALLWREHHKAIKNLQGQLAESRYNVRRVNEKLRLLGAALPLPQFSGPPQLLQQHQLTLLRNEAESYNIQTVEIEAELLSLLGDCILAYQSLFTRLRNAPVTCLSTAARPLSSSADAAALPSAAVAAGWSAAPRRTAGSAAGAASPTAGVASGLAEAEQASSAEGSRHRRQRRQQQTAEEVQLRTRCSAHLCSTVATLLGDLLRYREQLEPIDAAAIPPQGSSSSSPKGMVLPLASLVAGRPCREAEAFFSSDDEVSSGDAPDGAAGSDPAAAATGRGLDAAADAAAGDTSAQAAAAGAGELSGRAAAGAGVLPRSGGEDACDAGAATRARTRAAAEGTTAAAASETDGDDVVAVASTHSAEACAEMRRGVVEEPEGAVERREVLLPCGGRSNGTLAKLLLLRKGWVNIPAALREAADQYWCAVRCFPHDGLVFNQMSRVCVRARTRALHEHGRLESMRRQQQQQQLQQQQRQGERQQQAGSLQETVMLQPTCCCVPIAVYGLASVFLCLRAEVCAFAMPNGGESVRQMLKNYEEGEVWPEGQGRRQQRQKQFGDAATRRGRGEEFTGRDLQGGQRLESDNVENELLCCGSDGKSLLQFVRHLWTVLLHLFQVQDAAEGSAAAAEYTSAEAVAMASIHVLQEVLVGWLPVSVLTACLNRTQEQQQQQHAVLQRQQCLRKVLYQKQAVLLLSLLLTVVFAYQATGKPQRLQEHVRRHYKGGRAGRQQEREKQLEEGNSAAAGEGGACASSNKHTQASGDAEDRTLDVYREVPRSIRHLVPHLGQDVIRLHVEQQRPRLQEQQHLFASSTHQQQQQLQQRQQLLQQGRPCGFLFDTAEEGPEDGDGTWTPSADERQQKQKEEETGGLGAHRRARLELLLSTELSCHIATLSLGRGVFLARLLRRAVAGCTPVLPLKLFFSAPLTDDAVAARLRPPTRPQEEQFKVVAAALSALLGAITPYLVLLRTHVDIFFSTEIGAMSSLRQHLALLACTLLLPQYPVQQHQQRQAKKRQQQLLRRLLEQPLPEDSLLDGLVDLPLTFPPEAPYYPDRKSAPWTRTVAEAAGRAAAADPQWKRSVGAFAAGAAAEWKGVESLLQLSHRAGAPHVEHQQPQQTAQQQQQEAVPCCASETTSSARQSSGAAEFAGSVTAAANGAVFAARPAGAASCAASACAGATAEGCSSNAEFDGEEMPPVVCRSQRMRGFSVFEVRCARLYALAERLDETRQLEQQVLLLQQQYLQQQDQRQQDQQQQKQRQQSVSQQAAEQLQNEVQRPQPVQQQEEHENQCEEPDRQERGRWSEPQQQPELLQGQQQSPTHVHEVTDPAAAAAEASSFTSRIVEQTAGRSSTTAALLAQIGQLKYGRRHRLAEDRWKQEEPGHRRQQEEEEQSNVEQPEQKGEEEKQGDEEEEEVVEEQEHDDEAVDGEEEEQGVPAAAAASFVKPEPSGRLRGGVLRLNWQQVLLQRRDILEKLHAKGGKTGGHQEWRGQQRKRLPQVHVQQGGGAAAADAGEVQQQQQEVTAGRVVVHTGHRPQRLLASGATRRNGSAGSRGVRVVVKKRGSVAAERELRGRRQATGRPRSSSCTSKRTSVVVVHDIRCGGASEGEAADWEEDPGPVAVAAGIATAEMDRLRVRRQQHQQQHRQGALGGAAKRKTAGGGKKKKETRGGAAAALAGVATAGGYGTEIDWQEVDESVEEAGAWECGRTKRREERDRFKHPLAGAAPQPAALTAWDAGRNTAAATGGGGGRVFPAAASAAAMTVGAAAEGRAAVQGQVSNVACAAAGGGGRGGTAPQYQQANLRDLVDVAEALQRGAAGQDEADACVDENEGVGRLVVVDGSNVAMRHGEARTGGLEKQFSSRGVRHAAEYYLRRGYTVKVFLPDYLLNYKEVGAAKRMAQMTFAPKEQRVSRMPDSVFELRDLMRRGIVINTPAQDYDDSYAIMYAMTHDGCIVTNDRYSDFIPKAKQQHVARRWLRSHLISFVFAGDEFIPNPDFRWPPPAQYYLDGAPSQTTGNTSGSSCSGGGCGSSSAGGEAGWNAGNSGSGVTSNNSCASSSSGSSSSGDNAGNAEDYTGSGSRGGSSSAQRSSSSSVGRACRSTAVTTSSNRVGSGSSCGRRGKNGSAVNSGGRGSSNAEIGEGVATAAVEEENKVDDTAACENHSVGQCSCATDGAAALPGTSADGDYRRNKGRRSSNSSYVCRTSCEGEPSEGRKPEESVEVIEQTKQAPMQLLLPMLRETRSLTKEEDADAVIALTQQSAADNCAPRCTRDLYGEVAESINGDYVESDQLGKGSEQGGSDSRAAAAAVVATVLLQNKAEQKQRFEK